MVCPIHRATINYSYCVDRVLFRGRSMKRFIPQMPCIVPERDIFLTDVIGYDRLKIMRGNYTLKFIPPPPK